MTVERIAGRFAELREQGILDRADHRSHGDQDHFGIIGPVGFDQTAVLPARQRAQIVQNFFDFPGFPEDVGTL